MNAPPVVWNKTGQALWWILGLAMIGFTMSWLSADVVRLRRDAVVLVYLAVVGALLLGYAKSMAAPISDYLSRRWHTGLLVGLAIGALLAVSVWGQPGSPPPAGLNLIWALFWLGVVYGTVDALFLSVIPVWIVSSGASEPADGWSSHLRRAALALGASLLVTAAYHLGYEEFRGLALIQPLIGNALLTLGFILTGSSGAPIVGHIVMHAAAVLHGLETTVQLPPHY